MSDCCVLRTWALSVIWNWKGFMVWFHLLVGAAYMFHITLNAHILKTQQSDITSQGYLFSAVVIFLGNILVLLIGLPLLTAKVSLSTMFQNILLMLRIICSVFVSQF